MDEHHIADNPELAADYVLGRLSASQRAEIELHLRGCSSCRESVERELRIAAAAKRLGRDELKRRLAVRLQQPTHIAFRRALALAASVVILLGIGFVSRWIFLMDEVSSPAPTVTESLPAPAEPGTRDSKSAAPMSAAEGPRRKEESRDSKGKATSEDREVRSRNELDAISQRAGVPPATAVGDEAGGAAAEFWTEGMAITSLVGAVEPSAEVAERQPFLAKDKRADGYAKLDVAAEQQFVVTQRNSSDLPALQQVQRQQALRNTIPTLIEERAGQTVLTLYLDSLIDAGDLARARVEQRGDDSLVVRLQGQSIFYRVPQGRLRQQQVR